MATNYKVLGQVSASAATDTTLYAVPAATQAVVSSLVVCNRGAVTTFRVAVRPAGASIADRHYVVYDAPIGEKATAGFTLGMTLEATDVITVRSASGSVSFNAFGSEIS